MTYRELKAELEKLSEFQLDCDVTVYDAQADEFYGDYSSEIHINYGTDVLDDQHPYFMIKAEYL